MAPRTCTRIIIHAAITHQATTGAETRTHHTPRMTVPVATEPMATSTSSRDIRRRGDNDPSMATPTRALVLAHSTHRARDHTLANSVSTTAVATMMSHIDQAAVRGMRIAPIHRATRASINGRRPTTAVPIHAIRAVTLTTGRMARNADHSSASRNAHGVSRGRDSDQNRNAYAVGQDAMRPRNAPLTAIKDLVEAVSRADPPATRSDHIDHHIHEHRPAPGPDRSHQKRRWNKTSASVSKATTNALAPMICLAQPAVPLVVHGTMATTIHSQSAMSHASPTDVYSRDHDRYSAKTLNSGQRSPRIPMSSCSGYTRPKKRNHH